MHSAPSSRSGGIVSVLAVAGIVGSLMQTLVVPLVGELPPLMRSVSAWVQNLAGRTD
ncbi:hypothetical protein [Nonomuraea bangladeshensis]|uniref:hypothetical protein n=1 Tax=Nonomuraea bangladeshensis TaxID=404385 RepID=UPI003C2DDE47